MNFFRRGPASPKPAPGRVDDSPATPDSSSSSSASSPTAKSLSDVLPAASDLADTIREVLQKEGRFSFTDGSSVFTFMAAVADSADETVSDEAIPQIAPAGRFSLQPLGLSGLAIDDAVWFCYSNVFRVIGTWGWQNGLSRIDDFRLMQLSVQRRSSSSDVKEAGMSGERVFDVYHYIQELRPATNEEVALRSDIQSRIRPHMGPVMKSANKA